MSQTLCHLSELSGRAHTHLQMFECVCGHTLIHVKMFICALVEKSHKHNQTSSNVLVCVFSYAYFEHTLDTLYLVFEILCRLRLNFQKFVTHFTIAPQDRKTSIYKINFDLLNSLILLFTKAARLTLMVIFLFIGEDLIANRN